jgi:YheC/D like ATP-grasp
VAIAPTFDEQRKYFNKWEMHKLLSAQRVDACGLLDTCMYSRKNIIDMLRKYKDVYLKPIDGWGGKQISRIHVKEGGRDLFWETATINVVRRFPDILRLEQALFRVHPNSNCVIQQTAPVTRSNGKPFDIRVHMQKDDLYQWVFAGAVVRTSGTSRLVSNVGISQGSLQSVPSILKKLFPNAVKLHVQVKESLCDTGYQVCHALDQYQDFEEVGLDLGLDKKGQLWLFEVNTNDKMGTPSHELFRGMSVYEEMQHRFKARSEAPHHT